MRIMPTSLTAFHGWLPGRILLPVGFAAIVAVGTYVVADGRGYERARAEQASAKDVARLVVEPSEVFLADVERATKADRADIPVLLRAIDPAAVYQPAGRTRPAPARHVAERSADVLPTGVERFDRCEGNCDTRDPMVVRTNYPITASGVSSGQPEAASAPMPLTATESAGFALTSPGEIADRTVAGTQSAYGAVRDGAASVLGTMQQAVSGAIDLVR